jgi:hypothetical protein
MMRGRPTTKKIKLLPPPNRGAYKLDEACEYLGGLAPITVRRLIARGLIKRVPAIRHLVFAKAELDRFLTGGSRGDVG